MDIEGRYLGSSQP